MPLPPPLSASLPARPSRAHRWRVLATSACVGAVLALTGCAAMQADECAQADWLALGDSDAQRGENRMELRAQACAEHGMGVDRGAYLQGWSAGLARFCTAESGRIHGNQGRRYQRGFCPADLESDFLRGYTPAVEQHAFRQRVNALQQQIDSRNRALSRELGSPQRDERRIRDLRDGLRSLQQRLHNEMVMRP